MLPYLTTIKTILSLRNNTPKESLRCDYRYDDDVDGYHLQHLSTYNHSHMLEGIIACKHCFPTRMASDFSPPCNIHTSKTTITVYFVLQLCQHNETTFLQSFFTFNYSSKETKIRGPATATFWKFNSDIYIQ